MYNENNTNNHDTTTTTPTTPTTAPTTPTTPTATPTTSNFNKHSRKLQTLNPEALLSKSFRAAHALNEAGREAIVALSWGTLEFTV